MAEVSAQKDAIISEKDGQITILEDILTRVRVELKWPGMGTLLCSFICRYSS